MYNSVTREKPTTHFDLLKVENSRSFVAAIDYSPRIGSQQSDPAANNYYILKIVFIILMYILV